MAYAVLHLIVAENLINTFVLSWLDYSNALLVGILSSTLNRVQYVQHSAARILIRSIASDHTTYILEFWYWLPVRFHIELKFFYAQL